LFFGFLCIVPGCKQFHEITGWANLFYMRLEGGKVKPLRYGLTERQMEELDAVGVRRFTDFTWKQVLDFYSCADCGRCTDQCPATSAGRALSPREFSVRGQQLAFAGGSLPLSSTAEEIWSCTTCGACEQECPLGIEYIDKIVDLRRAKVEDGEVPAGLSRAFESLDQRGNPWGRAPSSAWPRGATEKVLSSQFSVLSSENRELKTGAFSSPSTPELLFFPDSLIAFDDRARGIADAACELLRRAGKSFGILPDSGRDSGHEARRLGEEFLFMKLRDLNTEAIRASGTQLVVTADPHALNAFRHDYVDLPRAVHITEVLAEAIEAGRLAFKSDDDRRVYVFHDPCYLGRHNGIYAAPRRILGAIPGLNLKPLQKQCDRSFCCGGPLSFFHEPEETVRPAMIRVEQAVEAGAEVVVTACPWCLVNLGEAAKSAGTNLEVIDITELAVRHLRS
jgi:Fe-S oxidoreductase